MISSSKLRQKTVYPIYYRRASVNFWRRSFFQSVFFSLIFSCASYTDYTDVSAIIDVKPNWQYVSNGVEFTELKIKRPLLKVYAVKIDLKNPHIKIITNDLQNNTGVVLSTKVSSFAKTYDCIAAINCGPFYPSNAKEKEDRSLVGIFISNGVMVSKSSAYDAIVFYKNGNAKILKQSEIVKYDGIENAVGGFYVCLQDGQFVQNEKADTKRHPRSAAGLSRNGNTLYLLAIDGRQLGSLGATLKDTATFMQVLGADTALNFDGGGSTALAVKINGKIKIVNKPIHNLIPGNERAVASCLGVVFDQTVLDQQKP